MYFGGVLCGFFSLRVIVGLDSWGRIGKGSNLDRVEWGFRLFVILFL